MVTVTDIYSFLFSAKMVERTSRNSVSPVSLLSPGDPQCATSPDLTPSDTDTGPLLDDERTNKLSEDNFDLSSKDSVDSLESHKQDKKKDKKQEKSPAIVGKCNCEELQSIEAHLETKDLWEKFHGLGTEMIITKSGRQVI